MTRLIVIAVLFVIVYWLARNIIRGFLRGLGLGNENVGRGGGMKSKKEYTDVQDAEFKDISDGS